MSFWNPDIDVTLTDSEDEDVEVIKKDYRGRDAILFVVDANLYEDPDLFCEALMIIRKAFISGMLVNNKDLCGLVFANTELSPQPLETGFLDRFVVPDNCAVFLPLRELNKPIVEHFMEFLSTAREKFGTLYGIAPNDGRGEFYKMLRLCINLFDYCGYTLNNATLVYMTRRETPHDPESNEFQISIQKAADLAGKDIEFHVIPMVDSFNYDIFYKEFICLVRGEDLDSFIKPDAQQLREILADRKLKQDYIHRSLGHFNFSLGPNLQLSALYFHYFHKRCYPRKVKLRNTDNALVEQKHVIAIRKQDTETLEVVDERFVKHNMGWHEINLGNMAIRITPQQISRVKNMHRPGMMLLGFKPRSELDLNQWYKPSNFMYPDDNGIIGSKRLFRALWQRCVERDKIAVCIFMRKRLSIPRYVALVPVESAKEDTKDVQALMAGDGFKIVYLPMAKHIRHNDLSDWNSTENTAPPEGVECFKKIIKKLRLKYEPQSLNDPELTELQTNLLALALNFEVIVEEDDQIRDTSKQDERIEKFLPQFQEIFGGDEPGPAKKRSAHGSEGGNAAKIPKASDKDVESYDFVEQIIANKAVNNCTVAQLLFILDTHFAVKMPKSSKKQVLVDRIYELAP